MDRSHGEEYDAAVGEGFAHHGIGDRRLQCIPVRLSAQRERWQRHSMPSSLLLAPFHAPSVARCVWTPGSPVCNDHLRRLPLRAASGRPSRNVHLRRQSSSIVA